MIRVLGDTKEVNHLSDDYLTKLFINESKPALNRHSGKGNSAPVEIKPLTITEFGTYDAAKGYKRFNRYVKFKETLDYDKLLARFGAWVDGTALPITDDNRCFFEMLGAHPDYGDNSIRLSVNGYYYIQGSAGMDYGHTSSPYTGWLSYANGSWYPSSPPKVSSELLLYSSLGFTEAELQELFIDEPIYEYVNDNCDGYSSVTVGGLIKNLCSVNNEVLFQLFSGMTTLYTTENLFAYDDTSSCTKTYNMFKSCTNLRKVGLFDTQNVISAVGMFNQCSSLKEIPAYDFRNCQSFNSFVYKCAALEGCYVKNISASMTVGSSTSYGHLLTLDSLIHLIGELRDVGSSLRLTIGNVNIEKLANVYVRTVDITAEMRAEDDLIDEKLPFIVCESTDDGACLITDYVSFKNWELA